MIVMSAFEHGLARMADNPIQQITTYLSISLPFDTYKKKRARTKPGSRVHCQSIFQSKLMKTSRPV